MKDLVPIRSGDDLRGAASVYEVDCPDCEASHWMVLMTPLPEEGWCAMHRAMQMLCPTSMSWRVAGCRTDEVCFGAAIEDGRLFRLDDGALRDEDQKQTRGEVRSKVLQALRDLETIQAGPETRAMVRSLTRRWP